MFLNGLLQKIFLASEIRQRNPAGMPTGIPLEVPFVIVIGVLKNIPKNT